MHDTFTRPFDLSEGNAACILPWQRDQIRRDCGGISAAVRSRPSYGDTKKLTLVGQTSLLDAEFDRAEAQARAHIASNFVKGVTCVGDHPASTKPEVAQKKAKTEADASTLTDNDAATTHADDDAHDEPDDPPDYAAKCCIGTTCRSSFCRAFESCSADSNWLWGWHRAASAANSARQHKRGRYRGPVPGPIRGRYRGRYRGPMPGLIRSRQGQISCR